MSLHSSAHAVLHLSPRLRAERPLTPKLPSSPLFDSMALLGGTREVLIRHGGEVYRLRHTRNDKLILTK
ncbi:MAG: hemin uptake protein HemP [Lysobacter sp.]